MKIAVTECLMEGFLTFVKLKKEFWWDAGRRCVRFAVHVSECVSLSVCKPHLALHFDAMFAAAEIHSCVCGYFCLLGRRSWKDLKQLYSQAVSGLNRQTIKSVTYPCLQQYAAIPLIFPEMENYSCWTALLVVLLLMSTRVGAKILIQRKIFDTRGGE